MRAAPLFARWKSRRGGEGSQSAAGGPSRTKTKEGNGAAGLQMERETWTYKSPHLWYGSVRGCEDGNFPTVDWVYYSHAEPGFTADKLTDCPFRLFPLGWDYFSFLHFLPSLRGAILNSQQNHSEESDSDIHIFFTVLFFLMATAMFSSIVGIVGSTAMEKKKYSSECSRENTVLVNRLSFHQF